MLTDPIADMLTRIRNASLVRKPTTTVPYSKMKEKIAKILVSEGFLAGVKVEGKAPHRQLVISLKYHQSQPAITHIKRISKPGLRQYLRKGQLYPLLSGRGIRILSTSQGIMTDKQARKKGVGGEVLCEVW